MKTGIKNTRQKPLKDWTFVNLIFNGSQENVMKSINLYTLIYKEEIYKSERFFKSLQ